MLSKITIMKKHTKQNLRRMLAVGLLVMLLSVCGCGRVEPVTPEQPAPEVAEADETVPEIPIRERFPVREFEQFTLDYAGEVFEPGTFFSGCLLPEIADREETPDCRYDTMATVYSYQGFTVQTETVTDPETGEPGSPFITNVTVTGAEVNILEGVRIGCDTDTFFGVFGSGFEELYGGYRYSAGDTDFTAYFDENGSLLYAVISLSEEVLDEMITDCAVVEIIEGHPPADYDGITFDPMPSLYYESLEAYQAADNFLEGVCARDENGNELEVVYQLYTPNFLEKKKYGPGIILYSAIDSEGRIGRDWRSFFVEVYTEKDEAAIEKLQQDIEKTTKQEKLENDEPYALKYYLITHIAYTTNFRLPSPVSRGASYRSGNCYVCARLLQTLLEKRGYHAVVVWAKNEKHNWVLVETEDGWRHIDSTRYSNPATTREGLQTDEERLVRHKNRMWDVEIWPACTKAPEPQG